MTEPAKLGAENFIVSRLYRSEMHVNREAGHRILFEAHGRNKETVDDVVSAQDHFDLAVHRNHHRSRNDIVLRRGILSVETQSRFATGRGIFKLRVRCAKLAVGPPLTEIPSELHAGHCHAHSPGPRPSRTRSRPSTLGT